MSDQNPTNPIAATLAASATVLRMTTWRARAIATLLTLALIGACAAVWVSPSSEQAFAKTSGPTVAQLAAENAQLKADLEAAERLAEQRRIEAKAATEREHGLISGQEKAAAQRAAQEAQAAADDAARAVQEKATAMARGAARDRAEQAAVAANSQAQSARNKASAAAAAAAQSQAKASSAQAKANSAQAKVSAAQADAAQSDAEADELANQLALAKAQAAAARTPSTAHSTPSTPTPAAPLVVPTKNQILSSASSGSRWWGMFTDQAPFNWGGYDAAELKSGQDTTLTGYFQGWDGNFRPEGVQRTWAHGQLPIMTWESRPLAAGNNEPTDPNFTSAVILSGKYDDYLRQYAKDVIATGLPLGIRLNHEMNGTWYPWSDGINTNQPGDYVKVWRHVHDIFEVEGANKYVIWIWAPNIVNKLYKARASLAFTESQFPGDGYVDWIGLSGYSRPAYSADYTPTFSFTYDKTLTQLRQVTHKPILLAEVGASEIGGYKPAWVKDFFVGLNRPENSDIIGFTWFNLAITTYVSGERVTNDWRIDSRGDSLANFKNGLATFGLDPLPPAATSP